VFVQEVDVRLAGVARIEANPRALACGGVVVVLGPRAGEGTSLSLGAVIAGTDRPLERPWVDPCRLNVLGGLASP
jgi:hypothetical protein